MKPVAAPGFGEESCAGSHQPAIIAENISKVYASGPRLVEAIGKLDLTIRQGEFLSLVGPSGCGKSTFLRMVAGLASPTSGQVKLVGSTSNPAPRTSVVFQEYAIFPWKTVLANVAFGLQMQGMGAAERTGIALDWIRRVGLTRFANNYPSQLSGGMKQRVAIARAFASNPDILLMDEPLGALDAQTRAVLQAELIKLWEEQRKTVLYVTHSLEEAVLMGDRVVLMTAAPSRIKLVVDVPFPRPRRFDLTGTPQFAELTLRIWKSLEEEVMRAMETQ